MVSIVTAVLRYDVFDDTKLVRHPGRDSGFKRRMHDLLRESDRLGPLHVRPHVHVLRMRNSTMARKGWRTLPPLSSDNSGRHSHLQIVIGQPIALI